MLKPEMTLISRPRRVWREGISDADMHYDAFVELVGRLEAAGHKPGPGTRVLDIGCGDRAPLALLMAAHGADVSAIDILPVALGWQRRPAFWARMVRDNARGAAKQMARDALHTWRYWRRLQERAGGPLPFGAVDLQQMDATALRFPDNSFDLIVSSAVWEHIENVDAATREVNRVLAPGGVAVIQIALFPALQGGHHAEWHDVSSDVERAVRPWDHLREGRRPFPVYLNQWREAQYREVFEDRMQVVAWEDGEMRGANYLTDELERELCEYSKRDLLLSSVTAWAEKAQSTLSNL